MCPMLQGFANAMENTAKKFGLTLKGPEHIGVDITNMCNMRCLHCYNRSNVGSGVMRSELSDGDLVKLAYEIKRIEPPSFCFCGGEPLIRYGVLRTMLACMRNNVTKAGLVTNGYLMTPDIANELADLGLYSLQVSVDGADAATHERMRGVIGGYEKAIAAIKMGWGARIPLRAVAFSPTKFNVEQFGLFVEQMHSLHVNTIRIQPLMKVGSAVNNVDIFPTEGQYDKLISCILEQKGRYSDINFEWGDPLDHLYRCRGLVSEFVPFVTIQVDGSIVASPYMPISIGNIKRHTIQEYWDAGLWRIWENKCINQLAGFYDSMSALSRRDVPAPVVYYDPNICFDLIDDRLLEIGDNEMQALYWDRVGYLSDAELSRKENLSDEDFLSSVKDSVRSGVPLNKVAIAIGCRHRDLDVVQVKSIIDRITKEMMLNEGQSANRLGLTYHRVSEAECAEVIDFIEHLDDGGGRNLRLFRFGLKMSSYNRLSIRSRMFQRMHHFYVCRNNGEIESLMCVVERSEEGCVSCRVAEVELLFIRHKDSVDVRELAEFIKFVEDDLIYRLTSEITMLRFVIGVEDTGDYSDLRNTLVRLGYCEEGRFGGLMKAKDVVLISKRLKKSLGNGRCINVCESN